MKAVDFVKNTLHIKNITIGNGTPKIIIPLVARNKENLLKKAGELKNIEFDVVELRADFWENLNDVDNVIETLTEVKKVLNDKLFLFTIRTGFEGGKQDIPLDLYTKINKEVADSKLADLIDVEILRGDNIVYENINNIKSHGVFVIGSNHDFFKTPPKDEIIKTLRKMQDMGADITKIAVMPTDTKDILTLLDASNDMNEKFADRPFIAISMGARGVLSRISGEIFGSCMTFGAFGETSAPGQLQANDLMTALKIIHESK